MSVRSILPAIITTAAGLALATPASAGGWARAPGAHVQLHATGPSVLGAVHSASHVRPFFVPHPVGFNGPIGLYASRGHGYRFGNRGPGIGVAPHGAYARNVWRGGFNGPVWGWGRYGGWYGAGRRAAFRYRHGGGWYGNGLHYGNSAWALDGGIYGTQIVNGIGLVGNVAIADSVYNGNACPGGPAVYDIRPGKRAGRHDPLVIYGIAPQCGIVHNADGIY